MQDTNRQPPRIESAFRALAYIHTVEVGGVAITPQGPQSVPARRLSNAEAALRFAALEVLRNYITGEILMDQALPHQERDVDCGAIQEQGRTDRRFELPHEGPDNMPSADGMDNDLDRN